MTDDKKGDLVEVFRPSAHSAKSLARANDEVAKLAKALEATSATAQLKKIALDASFHQRALKALAMPDSATRQIQAMVKEMEDHRNALRHVLGPLEDLKRLHFAETEAIFARNSVVSEAMRRFQEQFRRPEFEEINRIAAEIRDRLHFHRPEIEAFPAAMAQMKTPWLSIEHEFTSARSFAALQNIGESLRRSGAFDDRIADLVRSSLGDWRDRIHWHSADI